MTDSNTAYRTDTDLPEDDDPLAELARIVAGGPAPQAKEPEQAVASTDAIADETDIEAQLMRELGETEPAPIEAEAVVSSNGVTDQSAVGFSFTRQTPTVETTGETVAPTEDGLSLEEQLMAELDGGVSPSTVSEVETAPVADAQPIETVEAIAADLKNEVAASTEALNGANSVAVEEQIAPAVHEDELEDFFSDNFADMLESERAAELDATVDPQPSASLDYVDFGDAFEAELAAATPPAHDIAVSEPESLDELALEDEFAEAFENELELDDQPVVAAVTADQAFNDPAPEMQPAPQPVSGDLNEFDAQAHAMPAPQSTNSGFKLAVGALCIALLVGVGVVAWGSLGGNTGPGTEPDVIKADTEPAKIKPEEPGGTQIANQDNQVYNQVSGNQTEEPAQETLISSRETVSEDAKSTDRLAPRTEPATEQGTLGIAPKKVRTLTVKPDGTIIQSAPQETATLTPPVQTPVEPAPEAAQPAAVETTGTAAVEEDPSIISLDGAKSTGEIAVPSPSPLPAAEQLALAAAQTPSQPAVAAAPQPTTPAVEVAPQPTTQAADPNAPTQIANVPETPRPTVASSEWKVQVSSQRSRDAAEASFNNIKRRFASVLGDRSADIQRADVEGRGTFYRVKVLAASKSEASQICSRLKSAGGSCFVTR